MTHQEYIKSLEDERHGLRRERRTFLSICIIAALAMAILFFFIARQQHQITDANNRIQQERVASVFRNCQDQNARHDQTIQKLDHLLLALARPARVRAVKTRGFTVALINALAPKQDCIELVQRTVPSLTITRSRND